MIYTTDDMIATLSAECKRLEDDLEYNAGLVTEYRHELNNAVELLRTALNQYDAEASVGLPTTDRFGMDRRARTRQFLVAYDRKRA